MTLKCRHLLCTDNDKHRYTLSFTRRFLLTVKQTEKHLCALTVNRLYVNWRHSCSSIGNGASVRHRTTLHPLQISFNHLRVSQDRRCKCCAVVGARIFEGCRRVLVSNMIENWNCKKAHSLRNSLPSVRHAFQTIFKPLSDSVAQMTKI